MGFRTLEISHEAEKHIKEGQLVITTDEPDYQEKVVGTNSYIMV